jgi:hypothetical protein
VVLGARLLAFQPLHVALKPRVVVLLGTLPGKASLPLSRLLVMMLAVRQLPELPTGIGLGYGLQRVLEGLPVRSTKALAWRPRTSSAISSTVCSARMGFSFLLNNPGKTPAAYPWEVCEECGELPLV